MAYYAFCFYEYHSFAMATFDDNVITVNLTNQFVAATKEIFHQSHLPTNVLLFRLWVINLGLSECKLSNISIPPFFIIGFGSVTSIGKQKTGLLRRPAVRKLRWPLDS